MSLTRGFPQFEFEQRTQRLQAIMLEQKLDAIVLTTEPHVRYFSGFFTQFWQSPTRPWYLIVPLDGKPIAVIPQIGVSGMKDTWIGDIRSWPAPDPIDDGVSLLVSSCNEIPKRFGRIGFTLGMQSTLRMPVNDFNNVAEQLNKSEVVDVALLMHQLLSIKSELEIEKIRHVCEITSNGFNALPELISAGETQRQICKKLRIQLLSTGADDIPYMVAGSGPGGYDSIIMGPSDHQVADGEVLIIDTGTVFDGYFSDFDRNYGFGKVDELAQKAYQTVYAATEAGLAAAKPGATMSDLFYAMWKVLEAGGAQASDVGRMGHGLGMQLTEWPSITATDDTIIEPGMVITLEPAMSFAKAKQMVHEENIVITQAGYELLSKRAWPEMPII